MPEVVKAFDNIWASMKFISFEPCLGRLSKESLKQIRDYLCQWVIIGAQTPYSPKTAPRIKWVQEIVTAADKAGIPVFLKNNLAPLLRQNNHNLYSLPEWAGKQFAMTGDYSLAPTDPHPNEPMCTLRQELPNKLSENKGVVYLQSQVQLGK